jgi:hypothetical protein
VQAEGYDDETGHDGELTLVRLDPLTHHRGAGAEAHEDRREAQHEKDGSHHYAPPDARIHLIAIPDLVDGRAA